MEKQLANLFLVFKRRYKLNDLLSLKIDISKKFADFHQGSHQITLGRFCLNESSLVHEIRHAIVSEVYPKISFILLFFRILTLNRIMIFLAILMQLFCIRFHEFEYEIKAAFIYLYLLVYSGIWLEELDANLFAYKHTKVISLSLISQVSYSIPPALLVYAKIYILKT